jgi:lysozyme
VAIQRATGSLVEFLQGWESYRSTPYRDEGGLWTWGYGHAQREGERLPKKIDKNDALLLLLQDLCEAELAVNRLVNVALASWEFDAVASFTFNLGGPRFSASTLRRKLNLADLAGAAEEFGRWIYVKKKKSAGLVKRRAAERAMFQLGDYSGRP